MGRIVRAGYKNDRPALGRATAQSGDIGGSEKESKGGDGYLERVAKYVPAEIVAFFIFVNSILGDAIDKLISSSTPETYPALLSKALETAKMADFRVWHLSWAAVVVGLVMTPLYLLAVRDPKDPQEYVGLNIIVALAAFPVWAYAVNAVAFRPWHDGALASIFLATFSVISGAISPNLIASIKAIFKRQP